MVLDLCFIGHFCCTWQSWVPVPSIDYSAPNIWKDVNKIYFTTAWPWPLTYELDLQSQGQGRPICQISRSNGSQGEHKWKRYHILSPLLRTFAGNNQMTLTPKVGQQVPPCNRGNFSWFQHWGHVGFWRKPNHPVLEMSPSDNVLKFIWRIQQRDHLKSSKRPKKFLRTGLMKYIVPSSGFSRDFKSTSCGGWIKKSSLSVNRVI